MIKTNRINIPGYFKSDKVKNIKDNLNQHYARPDKERSQMKFPAFEFGIDKEEVRAELGKKTNNKCAYCESQFSYIEPLVDNFRPKSNAADVNGKISTEHYWWLALTWSNLFPACEKCSSSKRNFFPVRRNRTTTRYIRKNDLFNSEEPLLIDPEYENPEEYFNYEPDGFIHSYTQRGKVTIDILNLNRTELVDQRRKVAADVSRKLDELDELGSRSGYIESEGGPMNKLLTELLDYFVNSSIDYLGIRRFLVREFFKDPKRKQLKQTLNPKELRRLSIRKKRDKVDTEIVVRRRELRLDSIKIENFKVIEKGTIEFKNKGKNRAGWVVLIGENGVGKSSMLTATLKALLGRQKFQWRLNKEEIRRSCDEGRIEIFFNQSNSLLIDLSRTRNRFSLEKGYFLNNTILAFSPFKHTGKDNYDPSGFKGGTFVDNFFNPSIPLNNPQRFILQLSPEQFEFVGIALLDLLMLDNKARFHRNLSNGQVWYQYNDAKERHYISQLSDGYKSIITLGCNIIEGLLLNNESIADASGFVVIDEIGANLHPRWKMQIVRRLRRTFPNVQFLATTHDPLCLKGLEEGEVYVLRKQNDVLEFLNDLPNPSYLRADQLLTSEFFGLYSTQDPDTENLFLDYYKELNKQSDLRTALNSQNLNELRDTLRKRNHLGDSLREELLFLAIDTIIAKRREESNFSRARIEKEVKEKAIEMIDSFLKDIE